MPTARGCSCFSSLFLDLACAPGTKRLASTSSVSVAAHDRFSTRRFVITVIAFPRMLAPTYRPTTQCLDLFSALYTEQVRSANIPASHDYWRHSSRTKHAEPRLPGAGPG